jgi:hypothetical protein
MSVSFNDNNNQALVRREPWYRHPTLTWILKSAAINFILPFFNGVMLGFGEILANEVIFTYGWFGYSRPQLGLNTIPASATNEYKKTIKTEIKKEQKNQQQDLLLVD